MSFPQALARAPHALAIAVLAALPGLAFAQSNVQFFGTIDVGVLSQSKTRTGGSLTRVESSGLRPSVWGVKGTEDLGGGLTAFFNLESHIDIDTGTIHGSGDNGTPPVSQPMWRRQANVGLSSDWGTLIVGRQYGPGLLAHIGTEPRAFKEQFSNLYAWAFNAFEPVAGAGAQNSNNDVGVFMKNAIQYRHTVGPVSGGLLFSLGEQSESSSDNTVVALGLTYTGPVTLSFSHQFMKDQITGQKVIEHSGLGGAVAVGPFTVKANYLRMENSSAAGDPTSKVDAWGLGADWKWHPANTATLAYYNNKDKRNGADKTTNIVISNDYSLSKRTTLYAQAAFVDAGAAASLKTSIVADSSFRPDARTSFVNIGINHTF